MVHKVNWSMSSILVKNFMDHSLIPIYIISDIQVQRNMLQFNQKKCTIPNCLISIEKYNVKTNFNIQTKKAFLILIKIFKNNYKQEKRSKRNINLKSQMLNKVIDNIKIWINYLKTLFKCWKIKKKKINA
ncbi:unnamed protein product [Paramecium sonneborni]|uniref:Uncharacterized protein n=1 Tax=Paramecium sonneborni TaxID=65129 RepID=A0A8S1ND53_9CILI|nr:unnamed protein product [Paramecium sonneborni]